MDSSEATKVVISRVLSLVPEHFAKKIIGYMYFQGISDQEMIRLALGPDTLIHNLIQEANHARQLASSQVISPTFNPASSTPFPSVSPRPFPSHPAFRNVEPYWDTKRTIEQPAMQEVMPYSDCIGLEDPLDNENPGPPNYSNDYYCAKAAFNNLSIRGARNASNAMDYPVKACHYFNKGFCKHGSNCRYYHADPIQESYPHSFGLNSYDVAGDDQEFSPQSFEELEHEIAELLKSWKGCPVSIASLPTYYYGKYGKPLQAEGYLTESQRHGKSGYNLTKLLARLKNSIRVVDRPHGQHSVILAEDAAKYMDIRTERNDPGPIVSGSRQIYMTFPAESIFTEEDVAIYFSNYGPVQDVRIPCQEKRMFGFVTFVSADIAKLILSKGNPHFVCGARILVKPYREKGRHVERNKVDRSRLFQPRPIDIDSELQVGMDSSRLFSRQLIEEPEHPIELEVMRPAQLQLMAGGDSSRLFPRQLMEKQEQPVELEVMRPAQLQLMAGRDSSRLFPRQLMEEQECPIELEVMRPAQLQLAGRPRNGHLNFSSNEHFNYLFEVLNSGSTSDDNRMYPINNYGDHESSQGLNLPDCPFASVVASSISAVI